MHKFYTTRNAILLCCGALFVWTIISTILQIKLVHSATVINFKPISSSGIRNSRFQISDSCDSFVKDNDVYSFSNAIGDTISFYKCDSSNYIFLFGRYLMGFNKFSTCVSKCRVDDFDGAVSIFQTIHNIDTKIIVRDYTRVLGGTLSVEVDGVSRAVNSTLTGNLSIIFSNTHSIALSEINKDRFLQFSFNRSCRGVLNVDLTKNTIELKMQGESR